MTERSHTNLSDLRNDFVDAFQEWNGDNAPQFAGAIAFYAILSLAPLLAFTIAIAAIFFESAAARGEIVGNVQSYIGRDAAEMIQEVLTNASRRKGGLLMNILGFVVLAFGASRIFQQLKIALNEILDVETKQEGGIMKMLLDRLFSIVAVTGAGLFLMAFLTLNTILGRLDEAIAIPGGSLLWQIVGQIATLGLITVVFAMILRFLPDIDIPWRNVWEGATLAAILFAAGQVLIGIYLSRAEPGSSFGAAGPVIVVIVWIYFTTVIFFYGAEFMEIRSRRDESFSKTRERKSRTVRHVTHPGRIEPSVGSGQSQSSSIEQSSVHSPGTALAAAMVGFVVGALAAAFGLIIASARFVMRLTRLR